MSAFAPSPRTSHAELRAAFVVAGVTSTTAQIVLLRELLVISHGNELSLGLSLALWLLWTGLGSALAGKLIPRPTSMTFAILQAAAGVALLAALWISRACRQWMGAAPGEVLGPIPIVAIAAASLALFCVFSGSLFAVGSKLWCSRSGQPDSSGCSAMYLMEAAGSALGGILTSVVVLRTMNSFQIAALVIILALMSGMLLTLRTSLRRGIVALLLAAGAIPAIRAAGRYDARTIASEWPGFTLVDTRLSRYGSLAVIANEGAGTLLQNGLALFTVPDQLAAEESVHFPLLEHAHPQSVLLIGGALNGSMAEVLKHPSVSRVDFVELDPEALLAAEKNFPAVWDRFVSDTRVRAHHVDGRLFLKRAGSGFDVIVVSLPEPRTAQLNRYYTEEFFREAYSRLTQGGILSFHLPAGEEYRSPERIAFLRTIHNTLGRVFPETVIVPGESACFLAARDRGTLFDDAGRLTSRLRERGIRTEYISEYFLPYRMSPERVAQLRTELQPDARTPVNRDFAPIAYYYDVTLWTSQFSGRFLRLFQAFARLSFAAAFVLAVLTGVAGVLTMLVRHRQLLTQSSGSVAVLAAGWSLMTAQILLLLGFQVIYGYVFEGLAILIAAFMCGLALGSWMQSRPNAHGMSRLPRVLLVLQLAVIAAPVLIAAELHALSVARAGSVVTIVLTALLVGIAGGAQFSAAARLYLEGKNGGTSAGVLYALDLLGASAGALLVSLYLLPVFGFLRTSLLTAVAGFGSVLMLAITATRARAAG